jgi:hypothetical protein
VDINTLTPKKGTQMKKTIALSFLSILCTTNIYAMDGSAKAHAFNTKGSVSHNTSFNTKHSASFVNDTNTDKTITVMYRACAQYQDCDEKKFNIVVKAHSEWHDGIEFHKVFIFGRSNKYKSSAETVLSGTIYRREFSEAKIEIE